MYKLILLLITATASPEPPELIEPATDIDVVSSLGPSVAPVSAPPRQEEQKSTDNIEETQEGIRSLKNDISGLEFYLQDKKGHEKYCPYLKWTPPPLDKYKEDPKSHLPEDCKVE
jgi:hypothetical protein